MNAWTVIPLSSSSFSSASAGWLHQMLSRRIVCGSFLSPSHASLRVFLLLLLLARAHRHRLWASLKRGAAQHLSRPFRRWRGRGGDTSFEGRATADNHGAASRGPLPASPCAPQSGAAAASVGPASVTGHRSTGGRQQQQQQQVAPPQSSSGGRLSGGDSRAPRLQLTPVHLLWHPERPLLVDSSVMGFGLCVHTFDKFGQSE
eukprot:GHVU01023326.1.p2 GENE.GHVU01023326.1~~GHVU01023326.1.p2  ORF type:complete len:203 (-),score=28.09 GHVU01023326.1:361-969(-)